MSCAIVCQGAIGLPIHVDINLMCEAYPNIIADHLDPFMTMVSVVEMVSNATCHTLLRNGLKERSVECAEPQTLMTLQSIKDSESAVSILVPDTVPQDPFGLLVKLQHIRKVAIISSLIPSLLI